MKRVFCIVSMLVLASCLNVARASDKFFSTGPGTNLWNTTSNFWGFTSGGPYTTTWVPNDAAVLEGTGGAVSLATAQAANSVVFSVPGYSLTGNSLTLVAPAVISNNVSSTISSVLAGSVPVIKSGTGTLTLSGANTYTGGTVVSNGVLSLTYNSGANGTIKNDLFIMNGGEVQQNSAGWTLGYDGSANYVTNLVINGGTLNFAVLNGGIPAATVDMTGGVIKSGGGAVDWYRSPNAQATWTTHSNAVSALVSCGLNLRLGNTGFAVFNVENGIAVDDLMVIGPLLNGSGTQPITKTGEGQMTLMGTNTYSGTTTISGGTLNIAGAGQLGSGNYAAAITDNGNLTYASSAPQTLGGVISGSGALAKSGTGSLTLSGYNSYTGVTTANGGTLTLAAVGTQFSGTIKGDLVVNNATVKVTGINGIWGWDPTVMKTITLNSGGVLTEAAVSNVTTIGNVVLNGGTLAAVDSGDSLFGAWAFKAPSGNTVTVTVSSNSAITTPRFSLNGTGTGPVTVFDVAAGATLTVAGAVLNGGGTVAALTKASAGTMILSATNAYTGITTVNGGTLLVDGVLATGSAVTLNAGGWLGGTGTIGGPVVANAGGGMAPGDGLGVTTVSNLTLAAGSVNVFDIDTTPTNDLLVVARSGGLTNNGTAFLLCSNGTANVWVPAVGASFNLIQYSGTLAGTAPRSYSLLNLAPGYSYTFSTNGTYVSVTFGGPSVWSGVGVDDYWTTAANWGGIGVASNAALVFDGNTRTSNTNDFTAGTPFSILFTNTAAGFTLSGNQVALAGDVVNLSLNNQTLNNPLLLPLLRMFDTGSANMTLNGVLSGAGGLLKAGAGTLTLTATNTFSGLAKVAGGTLLLTNPTSLQGGTLDYNNYGGSVSVGSLTNLNLGGLSGSQELALTNDLGQAVALQVGTLTSTYNGSLSGSGALIKVSTGSLTLGGSSSNSYTGTTTINQGNLYLNKAAGVAAIPGTLLMTGGNQPEVICQQLNQFAAGATVDTTGASNWERLSLMGKDQMLSNVTDPTSKLILQNGSYGAGVGPANAVLTINSTTNGSIGGYIRNNDNGSGAVTIGLVKMGTGTLTLSGGNIGYTGATTVNQGRLVYNVSGNIFTPTVTIAAGAVLEVNPTSSGLVNYNVSFSGGGTYVKSGNQIWGMTYDNAAPTETISFSSGALIDVQGGTLRMDYGGGNWVANKANLTIANGATLDTWDNSSGIYVNALNGSGAVDRGVGYPGTPAAGVLIVGVDNGSGTFSGVIKASSGSSIGLTKTGTGTQTLTGTNHTYTGATTINGGVLAVNGSLAAGSAVSVVSGGTLGGTGNVAGVVTVASGGHVAPGFGSVGTLTNGGLALAAGSLLDIEFDLANAQTNDQVIVTGSGSLTINGGGFNLYSNGTTNVWSTPGTYALIQYNGAMGGSGAAALSVNNPAPNRSYTFSVSGGWVIVTIGVTTGTSWSGASAVDSKWQTATNWTGNVAPNPGDILTFAGSTRLANTNDFTAGTAFGGIVFNSGAGAFVLAGQSVTLAGTVFNYSTTAQTLALPVTVGAGGVTFAAMSGNMSVSGAISGSDPLTKSGSYALTLTGINSANGGLTVAAGTLELGGAGQLGSGSFSGAVTNNGALLVNSTANQTLSGVVSGLGGLTKSASGTLTLSGTNTYAGTTTLAAGRLALSGGDNRLPTNTTVSITGASTFDVGSTDQTIANLTLSATGTLIGTGTLTVNGSALTWTGRTLDSSGLNSFVYANAAGAVRTYNQVTWKFATNTVLTADTMYIGSSGGYANQNSTIQLGQAGTINVGTVGVLNDPSTGTININFASGLVSPSLTIRGTAGGGSRADWSLANVNNGNDAYGNVTMDLTTGVTGSILDARFGTLAIGVQGWSTSQSRVSNGTLSFSTGTLDATTIIVGRAYSTGGGGGGRGTLNINGGTVIVGTLTLAQAQSGNASQGTVNLNNGGTVTAQTIQAGVNYSAVRAINWNDGTIKNPGVGTNLTVSGLTSITLAGTGSHTFDISSGSTGNVNSAISGAGGLTKAGAGVVNLNAMNTYTGATTVAAGTLRLVASNALNRVSGIVMAGGTLDPGSYTNTFGTLTAGPGASTILLGSAPMSFTNSSATVWTGTINLNGTLNPTSMRIGTDRGGLTPDQMARMDYQGKRISLDDQGYVVLASGFLLMVQ